MTQDPVSRSATSAETRYVTGAKLVTELNPLSIAGRPTTRSAARRDGGSTGPVRAACEIVEPEANPELVWTEPTDASSLVDALEWNARMAEFHTSARRVVSVIVREAGWAPHAR